MVVGRLRVSLGIRCCRAILEAAGSKGWTMADGSLQFQAHSLKRRTGPRFTSNNIDTTVGKERLNQTGLRGTHRRSKEDVKS